MSPTHEGPLRVLVVDDDADFRDLLTEVVDGDPRFRVVATCGTTETLRGKLGSGRVDLVITDLMLGTTAPDQPLPLLVEHCGSDPDLRVLVVSSLATAPISRSIPAAIRHRIAFLPKSSALGSRSIMESLDDLLAGRGTDA